MQVELSDRLNVSDQGVKIRDEIDGKSFLKEHILANRPLLLRQMMHDWRATKNWSFEFFSQPTIEFTCSHRARKRDAGAHWLSKSEFCRFY